ncbi:MAG: DNA alkylation repair protein [Candidatus Margulisbacteria bacterium]|nr:DNA alkylation repair protein [Candidatus Margulisiibacteriota bacterium]
MTKTVEEIIQIFKKQKNEHNLAGMVRFGIKTDKAYGISIPELRQLAKNIGKNQQLADKLWESGIHEARLLACFIARPAEISQVQTEAWVKDFDSWDICDQCCSNVFDKTPWAYDKADEWSRREEEFVKRAGFVMMAALSVHDKKASDSKFLPFFERIKQEAEDERNFVRKAVNWALRQIGKRNVVLYDEAIRVAKEIQKINSKTAKWIAGDALREFRKKEAKFK